MTITPDTKDWTWVLDRACEECGFAPRLYGDTDPQLALAQISDAYQLQFARLESGDPRRQRSRPQSSVWSPLEYGAHVRDVVSLGVTRISQMTAEGNPYFANWDQDEAAISGRYEDQDPIQVRQSIAANLAELGDLVAGLTMSEWELPGIRSNGSRFSTRSFLNYLLHDLVHHLFDISGESFHLHGSPSQSLERSATENKSAGA